MLNRLTFEDAKNKVDALLELGETRVWVDEAPLELAEAFEPGGMIRCNTAVSGTFSTTLKAASDKARAMRAMGGNPKVTVLWSFNLEHPAASGSAYLEPDISRIRNALSKLRGRAREQFRMYIVEVADRLHREASDHMAAASLAAARAAELSAVATERPA